MALRAPAGAGVSVKTRWSAMALVTVAVLSVTHFLRPGGWIGIASYLAVTVGASALA